MGHLDYIEKSHLLLLQRLVRIDWLTTSRISNDLERLLPNKWALITRRIRLYKLVSPTISEEERESLGQIRNEVLNCLGRELDLSTGKNIGVALLCKGMCCVLLQSSLKVLRKGSRTIFFPQICLINGLCKFQNLIYQKIRCIF